MSGVERRELEIAFCQLVSFTAESTPTLSSLFQTYFWFVKNWALNLSLAELQW